jgi:hypothetical protein
MFDNLNAPWLSHVLFALFALGFIVAILEVFFGVKI